jgi:hypothetical protein
VDNGNGVGRTPDGRAPLVVQSATGLPFRVHPATGHARTLYVVQNRLNTIAVLRLDRAGTRGRLVDTLTDPRFDVPTTVARFADRLYLPNARFSTPRTPETAHTAVAVRR